MTVNRRDFLKAAGASLGGFFFSGKAKPAQKGLPAADKPSMLYDATICVGCKACQTACKKRSHLPPETDQTGLYEIPLDLSAYTWTLIQLYKDEQSNENSYVKVQCMHCLEPACVSACPVSALEKTAAGPIIYHDDRCFGCRYCMVACPYSVPKYQWDKTAPLIQKCDFCADRLAKGQNPACGDACPTGALIYGTRGEMMATAEKRISDSGSRYVNHIYGKDEGGGTSMLYIAGVSFDKLGYPTLGPRGLPDLTWPYMEGVPWLALTVATTASAIYWFTHRNQPTQEDSHDSHS